MIRSNKYSAYNIEALRYSNLMGLFRPVTVWSFRHLKSKIRYFPDNKNVTMFQKLHCKCYFSIRYLWPFRLKSKSLVISTFQIFLGHNLNWDLFCRMTHILLIQIFLVIMRPAEIEIIVTRRTCSLQHG